jgi:hypothetical protein
MLRIITHANCLNLHWRQTSISEHLIKSATLRYSELLRLISATLHFSAILLSDWRAVSMHGASFVPGRFFRASGYAKTKRHSRNNTHNYPPSCRISHHAAFRFPIL